MALDRLRRATCKLYQVHEVRGQSTGSLSMRSSQSYSRNVTSHKPDWANGRSTSCLNHP